MRTIRARLLVILLTIICAVLLCGGGAVYWTQRAGLMRQFDAGLQARAHLIASLFKLEPDPTRLIMEQGDVPEAVIEQTYFELHDEAGDLLVRSDNLDPSPLATKQPPEGSIVIEDHPLPLGLPGRVAWLSFRPRMDPDDWDPVATASAEPELLVVAVALDRSAVERALGSLIRTLLVVGCVVIAITAVAVPLGVRWSLKPLHRLRAQLGDVNAATMSRRFIDTAAPRELAPVYDELNAMLDRVEGTLERERSFASAAAHELRTPLAELRTTAEVALRWEEPQRTAAALAELLSIGGEMERLVESLLLMGRRDSAIPPTPLAPLDGIVSECVLRTNGQIERGRLNLCVHISRGATLQAPRAAVEIIARNLIENAVHHTPDGGRITITSNGDATTGLVVENGPIDLTDRDLQRMFEPFWRSDAARDDRDHFGLGLAIVRRIAEVAGLHVDSTIQEGSLRMSVRSAARSA